MSDILVYNEYVKAEKRRLKALRKAEGRGQSEGVDFDCFYSDAFFTLANTARIGYRVRDDDTVIVKQNVDAADTTGGIVWESAYLLLDYMFKIHANAQDTRSLIDLGAGTGLLGLSLSRLNFNVTVTEYNESPDDTKSSVFQLLHDNVTQHNERMSQKSDEKIVSVYPLSWDKSNRDIRHMASSAINIDNRESIDFDFVVGTDVLFAPHLVEPLLNAASILTKNNTGTCIFCMQIRCKDSHQLFLEKVGEYFDTYQDISEEVYATEGCGWGRHVECFVFEMKGGIRQLDTDLKITESIVKKRAPKDRDSKEHDNDKSSSKRDKKKKHKK